MDNVEQKEFNDRLVKLEPCLTSFARSLTNNNHADAKDLVQETYSKALQNREAFDDNNMRAWAFTIMRNTFINKYRRQKRETLTIDHSTEPFLLNRQALDDETESLCSLRFIEQAVNRMSDDFRIPFQMHVMGYKYEEVAEVLELKVGTVKSRIFFCRKKLMEQLQEYSEGRKGSRKSTQHQDKNCQSN